MIASNRGQGRSVPAEWVRTISSVIFGEHSRMNDQYIPRESEAFVRRIVHSFPSVALTGMRQAGKSTLLRHTFPDFTYVTFDDPLRQQEALEDPALFLQKCPEPVILDEIQYVPEITRFIKLKIDQQRNVYGRFILTGSQQFTLIKHLGDSLAGRIGLLELYPFSIHEKLRIPHCAESLKTPLEAYVDACLRGSFPELSTMPDTDPWIWYGSYLRTYIERDVRGLYGIGSIREFQCFMQLLATRCSRQLNMSSLANDVGVATNTIKNWISILESSRIIFLLPPWTANVGKRVVKSPKVYFADCGLVCYLSGIRDRHYVLEGSQAGALFENFVIQEIVKTAAFHGNSPSLYYLRTRDGLEIDLIIEDSPRRVIPVEIKLSQTPKSAMAAPMERCRAEFPSLKLADGHIVCLTPESRSPARGAIAEDIRRFLDWYEKQRRISPEVK